MNAVFLHGYVADLLPDVAIVLIGLGVAAALALFVIDTGRQIAIREGR